MFSDSSSHSPFKALSYAMCTRRRTGHAGSRTSFLIAGSGTVRPAQPIEEEAFQLQVILIERDVLARNEDRRQLDERHGVALVGHAIEELRVNLFALCQVQLMGCLAGPLRELLVADVVARARRVEELCGGVDIGCAAAIVPNRYLGLCLPFPA